MGKTRKNNEVILITKSLSGFLGRTLHTKEKRETTEAAEHGFSRS